MACLAALVWTVLVMFGVAAVNGGENQKPAFLKRFEHGYKILQSEETTTQKRKKGETTPTTQYTEPEFKRFCNDCEDYWHPKCSHYPHIYDDSKGCVLRTLSPQQVALMNKDSDEDENEEDSQYQDDGYNAEENEEEEGEKKPPEILMRAEELEAMRNQLHNEQKNSSSFHLNQHNLFPNDTMLNQEQQADILRHTVLVTHTTTSMPLETVWFSVENGRKVTIYKEVLDDAGCHLDMTINNAQLSCPREFAISQSSIPDVQLGVWTKVDLPAGVVMGPYRGKVIYNHNSKDEVSAERIKPDEHILSIYHSKTGALLFMVDGRSNTLGNWCRYVNAARHVSEQNIEVFFEKEKPFPYFRTIRPIAKNTELLCDFGSEYRKGTFTNLVNVIYSQPLALPLPKRQFLCSRCNLDQGSPIAIQKHRKLCNATKPKKSPRTTKLKHLPIADDDEEIEVTQKYTQKHTKPWRNRPKKH